MPTVQERSRKRKSGTNFRRREYWIKGAADDDDARAALLAHVAETIDGLPISDAQVIEVSELYGGAWVGSVEWSLRLVQYSGPAEVNAVRDSFDTGGQTVKITQSLETISRHGRVIDVDPEPESPEGEVTLIPPDYQGAINVTDDGVEGVEIVAPNPRRVRSKTFAESAVNDAYLRKVEELTGRTNNATFMGYAAGELLLERVTGGQRGDGAWEFTYVFAVSRNAVDIEVGDIAVPAKKGHEYLWIRYGEEYDEDAAAIVRVPNAAYVERVYESGDFAELNIT